MDFGVRGPSTGDEESLLAIATRHGTDKLRYCDTYELYLAGRRNDALNLFEIGVGGYDDPKAGGASIRMWKEYFSRATVFALDYHDKSPHQEDRIRIYQGSQADEVILRRIASDMGRVDVVLDDGSHRSDHIVTSFEVLFPLLVSGGLYIVEDIGTSYWPEYAGSEDLHSQTTAMAYFKRLADGLQADVFRRAYTPSYADQHAAFVHFWPNVVMVGKR